MPYIKVSKFLTYGLIDPRTGELVYVGKSSSGMSRPYAHQAPHGNRRNTRKDCWAKKLLLEGLAPAILILEEYETNEEALAGEIRLIAYFREAGFALKNHTPGGEGKPGSMMPEERKAFLAARMLGTKLPPETLAKMSERRQGFKYTEESKRKMAESQRNRPMTEERLEALRRAGVTRRGKKQSPELCAERSRKAKARFANMTPEEREAWSVHCRENLKKAFTPEALALAKANARRPEWTEERRKAMSERKLGTVRGPMSEEQKKAISKTNKGRVPSAETRAKMSRSGKGRIMSAETRAKMSAAKKGHKMPDAVREKLRIANAGKKLSAEHRAILIDALRKRVHTPEEKEKRRQSLIRYYQEHPFHPGALATPTPSTADAGLTEGQGGCQNG